MRIDRSNPYFRFLRARYSAGQEDWKTAEDEAISLLKNPEFEWDDRRLLVAIYAVRSEKIPKQAVKAKGQAMLVRGFSEETDWFSPLLMAIALNASGATDQALVEGEKSVTLAVDEQKATAESIVAAIRSDDPIEWDFARR